MTQASLGHFLRARRAQLDPDDVGLTDFGDRRRVTGLRREEIAQLAGVSVSYYTRLEQGQSVNASPAVLDAIAGALRLDTHERRHLHALAAARPAAMRKPPGERVDALVSDLLRTLGDVPAIVLGRRTDVLAWNAMGHALSAGHVDVDAPSRPADRPNMARMLFLDPHFRDLYVDWPRKARAMVGNLRLVAGRYPDDAALAALIGELSMKSVDFVSFWRDHRVKPCEAESYDLRHPLVGALTVTQQNLAVVRVIDQSISVVTTAENSASADSLALLARLIREPVGNEAEMNATSGT
jgi:transcriptional regulator with XRE-family HTH domain